MELEGVKIFKKMFYLMSLTLIKVWWNSQLNVRKHLRFTMSAKTLN